MTFCTTKQIRANVYMCTSTGTTIAWLDVGCRADADAGAVAVTTQLIGVCFFDFPDFMQHAGAYVSEPRLDMIRFMG